MIMLFDYSCKECNNTFEVYVNTNSPHASYECPECKSKETHRLVTNIAYRRDHTII